MFSRNLVAILPAIVALAPASLHAETPELAMVTAINLNMREEANASSDVVTVIPQGSLIIITEQDGPWFRGKYLLDGTPAEGWVHGNHIEMVNDASAAPPAAAAPAPAPRPSPAPAFRTSNPMQVRASKFDCDEGFSSDGYDSCTVDIKVSVDLPSAFTPYAAKEVSVRCESSVEYRTEGSFISSNDDESKTGYVYLSSGHGYTTIKIEHRFGYTFDPVINARLVEVSCEPSYY
jgi:uncharacterized protein YgiM (DUF1202 family)